MRSAILTADEALGIEKERDDRRQSRAKGLKLVKERDRNWAQIQTYFDSAQAVYLRWGFDDDTNFCVLEVRPYGGKTISAVVDAEELRKFLRYA